MKTRETLLARRSGTFKKVKILTASRLEWCFILNGIAVFLTLEVLKYTIQGISNFKSNHRLLKFFTSSSIMVAMKVE